MSVTEQKMRSIRFSSPMVRAILNGRKTQTRMVVKQKGTPGDILWVKETFNFNPGGPIYDAAGGLMDNMDDELIYRADRPNLVTKWTPSIHMPRWASRITLAVTGLRIERLQNISEDDCLAEGIAQVIYESLPTLQQCGEYDGINVDLVGKYGNLWDSIHGPGAWESNPWVWVIEFEQVKL